MLVACAVVEERAPLERFSDLGETDGLLTVSARGGRVGGQLERVECNSRVPVADRDEGLLGIRGQRNGARESALVREGAADDRADRVLAEGRQREAARPRQGRGGHFG